MMEYCRLPRGEERLSTLGLGLCGRSLRTHTASNRICVLSFNVSIVLHIPNQGICD